MITSSVESEWNGEDIKIKGKKVVNKSAFEIGLVVEGQAKLLCPVQTGRLAGSITTQSISQGSSPTGPTKAGDVISKPADSNEVLVGTNVEYAPYIEFGTIRKSAKPYLRPALDLAKGKTLTITKREAEFVFKDYLK